MDRKTLDKLISSTGAVLAVVLLIGGILLTWAGGFVNAQVSNQLTAQRITMPEGDAIANLDEADRKALEPFAGQPLEGPRQAQAFADHYILAHMNASSGGRTYEEVSGEFTKLSDEEKASEEGQALGALRQTLFMGNTLRGTLLTAYAFGTIGEIAFIAAGVAYVGGVGLGVLSFLGFRHAKKIQSAAQTTPVAAA